MNSPHPPSPSRPLSLRSRKESAKTIGKETASAAIRAAGQAAQQAAGARTGIAEAHGDRALGPRHDVDDCRCGRQGCSNQGQPEHDDDQPKARLPRPRVTETDTRAVRVARPTSKPAGPLSPQKVAAAVRRGRSSDRRIGWTADLSVGSFGATSKDTVGEAVSPRSESPSKIIRWFGKAFGASAEQRPSVGTQARCGSGIPSLWRGAGTG